MRRKRERERESESNMMFDEMTVADSGSNAPRYSDTFELIEIVRRQKRRKT